VLPPSLSLLLQGRIIQWILLLGLCLLVIELL
jgi:hypothetical protein